MQHNDFQKTGLISCKSGFDFKFLYVQKRTAVGGMRQPSIPRHSYLFRVDKGKVQFFSRPRKVEVRPFYSKTRQRMPACAITRVVTSLAPRWHLPVPTHPHPIGLALIIPCALLCV